MQTTALGAALILLLVAANASAQQSSSMPSGVKTENTSAGPVLADTKGMTFYIFDRDTTADKSACNGQCAQNWPPVMASGDAKPTGDWTVITRDDGSKQWAHKGKPLYTWSKDTKPGDTTGDGFNNVWHVAKP
jgi:predicted lipoprotein with Yx(FWY)xxD motif